MPLFPPQVSTYARTLVILAPPDVLFDHNGALQAESGPGLRARMQIRLNPNVCGEQKTTIQWQLAGHVNSLGRMNDIPHRTSQLTYKFQSHVSRNPGRLLRALQNMRGPRAMRLHHFQSGPRRYKT